MPFTIWHTWHYALKKVTPAAFMQLDPAFSRLFLGGIAVGLPVQQDYFRLFSKVTKRRMLNVGQI